jgi:outer membrane protein insertion porin family
MPYRAVRLFAGCLLAALVVFAAQAQQRPPAASPAAAERGGVVRGIRVDGNQRIEAGTIRSYLLIQSGDRFEQDRIDRSLRTLYATGLFQDVRLSRVGDDLIVRVVENPLVNRVAFEGNKKLSDDQLRGEVQVRARAVFTPSIAEVDRKRILDLYAQRGYYAATVEPKIIRLDQNRVDVVFQVEDGAATLISRIAVVGNKAFSENRLSEVISAREERWWRFLVSTDQYDPERLNYDRELLRRFYLKNGYADIQVGDAVAELSPDRKSFFVTYTVREGERYRMGKVAATTQLRNLTSEDIVALLPFKEGEWYDGDAVGKAADLIEEKIHNRGYAFVDVKPRMTRDAVKREISVTYEVGEGPRVYVERIEISGNVRTKDKVIRREFRVAEGDAFNAEAVRRTRSRLTDLGYFNTVDIQTQPGSAPDKAVVQANIVERATGELTLGGGYSTDAGALMDLGLAERNMIGTGINASIRGIIAQKRSSINFSVTDPYFLDRNLVAGFDIFLIRTNYLGTQPYDEKRGGFALRAGYDFNENFRQVWSYALVKRDVFNIYTTASPFILNERGTTLLSQVSQVVTADYRDSRIQPRSGWVVELGTDMAGLGGDVSFVRTQLNGAYYHSLERYFGHQDWGLKISGGMGYLANIGGKERIIDRFFLGGENLRGFQIGGAGPHDQVTGDPLGGRKMWTQTTELRFPLPVSEDLGITGRAFVDVGSLFDAGFTNAASCVYASGQSCRVAQSAAPRLGAGVGISWRTQFGLINVDLTPFVSKQALDRTQVFRFGFGTRF